MHIINHHLEVPLSTGGQRGAPMNQYPNTAITLSLRTTHQSRHILACTVFFKTIAI